jgi:hypothetical protein
VGAVAGKTFAISRSFARVVVLFSARSNFLEREEAHIDDCLPITYLLLEMGMEFPETARKG